jgi:hypothetical protein
MTADKAALLDLRDRLKAAMGPDPRLDRDLFVALSPSPFSIYQDCIMAQQGGFAARVEFDEVPRVTGSLDAAVGLVPEGDWGFHFDIESVFAKGFEGNVAVVAYLWSGHPTNEKSFCRSPAVSTFKEAIAHLPLLICLARIEYELAKVTDHA